MDKTILAFIIGMASFINLSGATEQVRLNYLLNTPLEFHSVHTLDIAKPIPGFDLQGYGKQTISATVSLESDQKGQAIKGPPFDIVLKFNGLKIDLKINETVTSYDTLKPGDSKILKKIAKIFEEPLRIHVGDTVTLDKKTQEFDDLMLDFPFFKQLDPRNLLQGIIQPILVLNGKDLTVGSTFQLKEIPDTLGLFPETTYVIETITDKEVTATIKGSVDDQKLKLSGVLEAEDKANEWVNLIFNGKINGKATWNRENALLFNLNSEHSYNGLLKIANWEWPLDFSIKVEMETKSPAK